MDPAHRTDPHLLTMTRVLAASPQAVFDAWTTAESVQQWMCPEAGSAPLVEMDVRVGGTFRVDMLLDGDRTVHTGVYREIEPPERLVFTWTSKHTRQRETLVTVVLRAVGDGTELTLTQTLLPDAAARESHKWGWARLLDHLAVHLG